MANHKLIKERLTEASKRGYLKPTKDYDICLADYINSANKLLAILKNKGENGANIEQLVKWLGLSENTCKIYARELGNLGFLERSIENRFVIWRWK
ncbi:hypothetical protein [Floridanema evergladense]|uniref:Uncharacterized protein n=1 Tax=Floridaenema evergladense BLCC-F167 TaxID=3153639 RepID=A0ABV4WCX0_9CYAN